METIKNFINDYLVWLTFPKITLIDVLEILIIAFIVYQIIVWVKNTRAWVLIKGISVVIVFYMIALLLQMNVILWIFSNSLSVVIMAVIIVFQPELRKALEQLGRKDLFRSMLIFDEDAQGELRLTDKTISELVKATFELGKAKTGALIVIQQETPLDDFIRTGILLDSAVSSQLLINIFEHNTPLHDGAVIMKDNRIVAATCYLPLSDSMELSKELGTRHRAGVGISEETDSLTIIVSEETGKVSVAVNGGLVRNVDSEYLKKKLTAIQGKKGDTLKKKVRIWKGKGKKHNEKKETERTPSK